MAMFMHVHAKSVRLLFAFPATWEKLVVTGSRVNVDSRNRLTKWPGAECVSGARVSMVGYGKATAKINF